MKTLITKSALCMALSLASLHSFATQADAVSNAQNKLKATFKNLQFTSFQPGPLDGLYEIHTGSQIIYFHPEKELLLMGEFYTKEGKSLTAEAIEKGAASVLTELPMDKALVIGSEEADKTIIEFTDPNCGFCKSYDRFVTTEDNAKKVKRQIFFDTRGSEESRKKVVHILCSTDPEAEMKKIYHGIEPEQYLNCAEGNKIQKVHAQAGRSVGTQGTPSFIIDGKLTLGFRPNVKEYINQ